jgi:hypothetical protein
VQQPLLVCQTLEVAVRSFVASAINKEWCGFGAAVALALTTAVQQLTTLAATPAAAEAGGTTCGASLVGVAELQMLRQLPLQRLLSLLLSCMKLASTSVATWGDGQQQNGQQQDGQPLHLSVQVAAACVGTCVKLQLVLLPQLSAAAEAVSGSSSSSSSSSSTTSAAVADATASVQEQQLLAVVVARGMRVVADCILAAAAAGATGSDDSNGCQWLLQIWGDKMRGVLVTCRSSLLWLRSDMLPALQLPGADAAAGAAVLQPLLQQQEQLQLEVEAALNLLPDEEQVASDAASTRSSSSSSGSSSSSSGSSTAEVYAQQKYEVAGKLPSLAEQLVTVADAVCAQLPAPLCCNNPSCRSLECVSELQLVGGKGNICSRCRCVTFAAVEQGVHCCCCWC